MNENSIINYMICMITTFKKVLYVKLFLILAELNAYLSSSMLFLNLHFN